MTGVHHTPLTARRADGPRRRASRAWVCARLTLLAVGLLLGVGLIAPARSTAQEADGPASCRVGVHVLTIHTFNTENNTFDAGFWLWSVCPDDTIAPLDKLDFVNANEVTRTFADTREADGGVWSYVKIEGTFRYFWDLTDFPFDRHRLEIRMENADYDTSMFFFDPDTTGSAFEPDMPLEGWDVAAFGVGTSVTTYQSVFGDPDNPTGTTAYNRFTVNIELVRNDLSGFIRLTFVVYLAFLLSLVGYFVYLEPETMLAARLGVVAGAVFAVAVNLHTVTATLGNQEGLSMVDKIHVAAMVAIILGAVNALATQVRIERGDSEVTLRRFDRTTMAIVLTGYLLYNGWLVGTVMLKYW